MSFRANIEIQGLKEPLRLLQCSYSLKRDTKQTGEPSSEPQGGFITFEVESSDDNTFYEWMVDPYTKKNGSVIFYRRDQKAKLKELSFTEAYLVSYAESFDASGAAPMKQTLTISAKTISINGATLKNPWPA